MTELQVVEGKLSEYYNHFGEYEFTSCEATETRLMGAVAFCVTWTAKDNPQSKFYQVFHLDYSEYGIDDYYEFICTPDSKGKKQEEEMYFYWNKFISVMGGRLVTLPPKALIRFVDAATPIALDNRVREFDTDENRIFRKYAVKRLNMMKKSFIRTGLFTDSMSEDDALSMLIPKRLSIFETINYFIMRLVDLDFSAAAYLSSINCSELENCPLAMNGIQSLIRNSITSAPIKDYPSADGKSSPYRCKSTTLRGNTYYFSSYIIWLETDYNRRAYKVRDISVGTITKLSEYEAALQIAQTEHITVFDCKDSILNEFDGSKISALAGIEPKLVPNGWLYTIYNKDNSHVDKAEYRISDDVYGYALLTITGEFAIMSHKIMNISVMDNSVVMSFYSPYMKLNGRYTLDTPIFQTLCQIPGIMFKDLTEIVE